jgi:hypothetical protein
MRVRPQRPTDRRPLADRRPHVIGRPVADPPGRSDDAEAEVAGPADTNLAAERRHRASVAPEDQALYSCSCGYVFQASVSTSVACPQCGTCQAW